MALFWLADDLNLLNLENVSISLSVILRIIKRDKSRINTAEKHRFAWQRFRVNANAILLANSRHLNLAPGSTVGSVYIILSNRFGISWLNDFAQARCSSGDMLKKKILRIRLNLPNCISLARVAGDRSEELICDFWSPVTLATRSWAIYEKQERDKTKATNEACKTLPHIIAN